MSKKWETKILKDFGEENKEFQYGVGLIIGNQKFTLVYFGNKKEARWMKEMLDKAINSIVKD